MVEVQIRCDCKECGGKGRVQHPDWADFYAQPNAQSMTDEEAERWFEDRGLMSNSAPYMGRAVRLFPDDEIPCCECEGKGKRCMWVPVESIMAGQPA